MKRSLLGLTVGQAVTEYVLHLCKQADEACVRLQYPDDVEALHDFRVAIRRSRTWLRTYHLYLPLSKALRKRLRALARSTNDARDAEVSVTELQTFSGELNAAQTVGLDWLLARFEKARQESYVDVLKHIPHAWPPLAEELRHRLHKEAGESALNFSQVSYELVASAAVELGQIMESIGGLQDIEAIHQSRIAAKRLRYLLEPFKSDVKGIKEAVEHLTALQDAMGGLHDGYVLEQKLAVAVGEVASLHARQQLECVIANPDSPLRTIQPGHNEQTGLFALARLTALQQQQRFADVQAQYLGRHLRSFLDEIESPISHLVDVV